MIMDGSVITSSSSSSEDDDETEDEEEEETDNSFHKINTVYANKIEEVASKYTNNPNTIITSNDTIDVEKILANEFSNCAIKDRTEIQEEIHGVHCMAPDETPELLTRRLKQLSIELDNDDHIPVDKKQAYILSRQLQQEHEHNKMPYVNCIEFRLMYLRCEFFDVKKTAKRLVQALDFLLENFGSYALERKIKLSDFTKEELNGMRKGFIQLLPSRDRGGRRITVVFPGNNYDSAALRTQQKIGFYLSLVCATDIENQRKGVVSVVWIEKLSFNNWGFRKKKKLVLFLLPVRVVSIHFCAKDIIARSLAKAVVVARLNTELRVRFISHLGECVENRYLLKGYGIPVDSLPITWTGTIKTENIKRFINLRYNVENNSNKESNTTNRLSIIECPYLNDILFKKGNHTLQQSGNIQFQSIVWSIYKQHLQQQHHQNGEINKNLQSPLPPVISAITTKMLVPDILNKIKQDNLRVLVWDKKNGWWNCFNEESDYRKHIHFGALHILSKEPLSSNNLNSTSMITVPTSISASASASASETKTKTILNRKQKQQVNQSETSIFSKKRKLSYSSDDDDDERMLCGQCFGMSFVPYDVDANNYSV